MDVNNLVGTDRGGCNKYAIGAPLAWSRAFQGREARRGEWLGAPHLRRSRVTLACIPTPSNAEETYIDYCHYNRETHKHKEVAFCSLN